MAYATLDQLKAELNITKDNQDELLADKLTDAQAVLELIYKRCFEAPEEEETRYVDYDPAFVKDGRRGLLLPQAWDVCQISQVVNGDGTVITPDKYVTEPRLRNVSGGVMTLPPFDSCTRAAAISSIRGGIRRRRIRCRPHTCGASRSARASSNRCS